MDHSSSTYTNKSNHPSFLLGQYMSYYGLMDNWRLSNPSNKEHSYSPYHKSYSRIDYFLVNNSITHKITDPTIHSVIISDHAPTNLIFPPDGTSTHYSKTKNFLNISNKNGHPSSKPNTLLE